jgi:hypothetical protein
LTPWGEVRTPLADEGTVGMGHMEETEFLQLESLADDVELRRAAAKILKGFWAMAKMIVTNTVSTY